MATLQDVAREAGVSTATVSLALREAPRDSRVGTATRERVRAVAHALGYRPNVMARSLRKRHSNIVSLFFYELANPFFGQLAEGISNRLHDRGYLPMIANSGLHVDDINTLTYACGSVLMTPDPQRARDLYRDRAVVGLFSYWTPIPQDELAFPVVQIDYASAYRELGRRLVPSRPSTFGGLGLPGFHAQKYQPAAECLEAAGCRRVHPPEAPWAHPADAARAVVHERVDVVFCDNDLMAAQLVNELARLGRAVPGDVTVVGCDATLIFPGVWTVRVDFDGVAEAVVDLLARQLDEPAVPSDGRTLFRSVPTRVVAP